MEKKVTLRNNLRIWQNVEELNQKIVTALSFSMLPRKIFHNEEIIYA